MEGSWGGGALMCVELEWVLERSAPLRQCCSWFLLSLSTARWEEDFIAAVQVDKQSALILPANTHTHTFSAFLPLTLCQLCNLFMALFFDFFYYCFISQPEHLLRIGKVSSRNGVLWLKLCISCKPSGQVFLNFCQNSFIKRWTEAVCWESGTAVSFLFVVFHRKDTDDGSLEVTLWWLAECHVGILFLLLPKCLSHWEVWSADSVANVWWSYVL